MLTDREAAALQRQITTLLNLWRLEPFYFRHVSEKYKHEFEICRTSPPGSIEFEPEDLPNYSMWLDELVQSNMCNHNGPPHLTAVAVSLNLSDVILKFLRHENTYFAASEFLSHHLYPTKEKAERLQLFLNSYEDKHFKFKSETLRQIQVFKRVLRQPSNSHNIYHLTEINHHYITVMGSLITDNRNAVIYDPVVLRLAIHHGDPEFLKDLLSTYPNSVLNFRTEPNKAGLVEYAIQCWVGKIDDRHVRMLQTLAKYGADLNDTTTMLHHEGVPELIVKTLAAMHSTKSMVMTQSFIGQQGTNAQNSASSSAQIRQNQFPDF